MRPTHLFAALVTSLLLNIQLAPADEMITRVFNVSKVLTANEVAPEKAPDTTVEDRLVHDFGIHSAKLPPTTRPDYEMKMSELIDLVHRSVTPDAWTHNARVERFGENELVVYAPAKTQEAVVALLDNLRQQMIHISIETQFVTINAASLKSAGIAVPQTKPSEEAKPVFLTSAQIDKLLKTSHHFLHSPHAEVLSGQGAALYHMTYFPYVRSLDVSTVNSKTFAVPRVDYAHDGVVVTVEARTDITDPDIDLAVDLKQLNFKGFKTSRDPQHKELSWQTAQTDEHEAKATLSVPHGKSLMLALSDDEVAIVTPKIAPN